VKLGPQKTLPHNGDHSASFQSLQKEGCDSTVIHRRGGTEHVAYSSDQVVEISTDTLWLKKKLLESSGWRN
jgi:hypothetical protein